MSPPTRIRHENNDNMKNSIAPIGLLLILLATIAPFFLRDFEWAVASYKYVYCAGAVILLIARLMQKRTAKDLRLRRLYRLDVWVAVLFCVGGFFLFYPDAQLRDWIAFTLAGAALQAYTSIAIPSREKSNS